MHKNTATPSKILEKLSILDSSIISGSLICYPTSLAAYPVFPVICINVMLNNLILYSHVSCHYLVFFFNFHSPGHCLQE